MKSVRLNLKVKYQEMEETLQQYEELLGMFFFTMTAEVPQKSEVPLASSPIDIEKPILSFYIAIILY